MCLLNLKLIVKLKETNLTKIYKMLPIIIIANNVLNYSCSIMKSNFKKDTKIISINRPLDL